MEHSKGVVTLQITVWVEAIFIAAADCKLPCILIPFLLIMVSNYSNDDLTGICNVESIQEDSLYPLAHLCTTGHCVHCFHRCF